MQDDSVTPSEPAQEASQNEAQDIFEDRAHTYISNFQSSLAANDAKGVMIVMDPKYPGDPVVYSNCSPFMTAQLLTKILRGLRNDIISEITP